MTALQTMLATDWQQAASGAILGAVLAAAIIPLMALVAVAWKEWRK